MSNVLERESLQRRVNDPDELKKLDLRIREQQLEIDKHYLYVEKTTNVLAAEVAARAEAEKALAETRQAFEDLKASVAAIVVGEITRAMRERK